MIKVQFVTGTILTGNASVTVNIDPVGALSKAFVLTATTQQHCGVGNNANPAIRAFWVTADLTAVNTLVFDRGQTSGGDCPCAAWIIEFIGQPGDPDEFVMRGKTTTTFALTTDLTAQSAPIPGIVTPAKVVPFMNCRLNTSSNNTGTVTLLAAMGVDGSLNNVNNFTRLTAGGQPVAIVYNVEFLGLTSVQTLDIANSVNDTDRDNTISTVTNINQAWVYSQLQTQNDPDDSTYYAWLTSPTNLRTHLLNSSSVDTLRVWVLSNPGWKVQHVGTPDGVADFPDTTDPQAEIVAFPNRVDQSRALVIGHSGSNDISSNENPCAVWRWRLVDDTHVEAFRASSIGTSEYTFSVVEFGGGIDASVLLRRRRRRLR